MNATDTLFIRKRASDLRAGQRVRTRAIGSARWGSWTVVSVERSETVLMRGRQTLRISPGCTVLLPIQADLILSH